jgi:allophanate hydrolase
LPTTAACPSFATVPEQSSQVVQQLVAAGAVVVGKTNMDQFATGLTGTRSPHGAVKNAFDERYISGGSSSGSAVAVARGHVSFALGTDTAGSGRVPAAFNDLIGMKPSPGLISTRGVVPACRSLDCVSIFALSAGDAHAVLDVAAGFDELDPFSRRQEVDRPLPPPPELRLGIPSDAELTFFGDASAERAYARSLELARALGIRLVPVDFVPFRQTAELLYQGAWLAERWAALEAFFATNPPDIDRTVDQIVRGGASITAADAFRAAHRLAELRRRTEAEWSRMDALLLPTAPTIYTIAEIERDPVVLNARLGQYTNFVNLLGLCAVAVPAGFRADGLPFGVSVIAPAGCDRALLGVADTLHRALRSETGRALSPRSRLRSQAPVSLAQPATAQEPSPPRVLLAVVGAHLSGQPLNGQLTSRGASLIRSCRTARDYRLYALSGTRPAKPGLCKSPGFAGPGLEVEVWELDLPGFGAFVAEVPPPLAIGNVELEDASWVKGFVCEPAALAEAREITDLGGWRTYLATLATETGS